MLNDFSLSVRKSLRLGSSSFSFPSNTLSLELRQILLHKTYLSLFLLLTLNSISLANDVTNSLTTTAETLDENSTETELPSVTVTASRVSEPLTDAMLATTVINRHQIQSFAATDVYDVLTHVPALEMARGGGQGQNSSIFIRGSESDQVLILVDGLPVNMGSVGTGATLDLIQPEDIERIEVVRGNVSALYGSQAMGGVIQIMTQQGRKKPDMTVTTTVGTRGTYGLAVSGGGQIDNLSIGGSLSAKRLGGTNAYAFGNPDRDTLNDVGGTLNLAYTFAKGQELSLGLLSRHNRVKYDDTASTTDDTRGKGRLNTWQIATKNQILSHWQSLIRVGQSIDRRRDDSWTSEVQNSHGLNQLNNLTISTEQTFQFDDAVSLMGFFEWQKQKLRSDYASESSYGSYNVNLDQQRTARSIGMQLKGLWPHHQLQAAVRHDRYSDFGHATTGLVAYGLKFADNWRGHVQWSNAFKAPSLSDLYYPNYNNPGLKAERSNSFETGLQWENAQNLLRATLFYTRYSNLIEAQKQKDSPYQLFNVAKAKNQGIELVGQFELMPQMVVNGAMTFQRPKNDHGESLLRRAKFFANVGMTQKIQNFDWSAQLRYQGKRQDNDFSGFPVKKVDLKPYFQLDLTAGYRISPQVKVNLRFENVFNRHSQDVYGYHPQPRGVFMNLLYQPLR